MTDNEHAGRHFVTDIFEGPLDLLLYLIRKHEVNICDISIIHIADQYNRFLSILKEIDLDIAGEYLQMAATLVYLKSRAILPKKPSDGEEEQDAEDVFIRDLAGYERYRAAADALRSRESSREMIWSRPDHVQGDSADFAPAAIDADLLDLVEAFRDLLNERKELLTVSREEFSVEDKMAEVMSFLADRKSVDFRSIFSSMTSRIEMIVAFLAMLELIKMGVIRAYQSAKTGAVRIYRKKEFVREKE